MTPDKRLHVRGAGPSPTNGTNLWFANTASGMVEVLSCVNVTVEGLSMDTVAPTFGQGKLLSFSRSEAGVTAMVAIDEGFPAPISSASAIFNETCPDGSAGVCGEIKMIYWDPETRQMVPNAGVPRTQR